MFLRVYLIRRRHLHRDLKDCHLGKGRHTMSFDRANFTTAFTIAASRAPFSVSISIHFSTYFSNDKLHPRWEAVYDTKFEGDRYYLCSLQYLLNKWLNFVYYTFTVNIIYKNTYIKRITANTLIVNVFHKNNGFLLFYLINLVFVDFLLVIIKLYPKELVVLQ